MSQMGGRSVSQLQLKQQVSLVSELPAMHADGKSQMRQALDVLDFIFKVVIFNR